MFGNTLGPAAAATLTRKLSREGGYPEEQIRDGLAAQLITHDAGAPGSGTKS